MHAFNLAHTVLDGVAVTLLIEICSVRILARIPVTLRIFIGFLSSSRQMSGQ
jgi:hypothetical protein